MMTKPVHNTVSQFSDEEKAIVVKRVIEVGPTKAAQELGMSYHNAYQWHRKDHLLAAAKLLIKVEKAQQTKAEKEEATTMSVDKTISDLQQQLETTRASAAKQALQLKEALQTISDLQEGSSATDTEELVQLRYDKLELKTTIENLENQIEDMGRELNRYRGRQVEIDALEEEIAALKVFAKRYFNGV